MTEIECGDHIKFMILADLDIPYFKTYDKIYRYCVIEIISIQKGEKTIDY